MIPEFPEYFIRVSLTSPAQTQEESNKIHLELWRAAATNSNMRFNTLFFLLIVSCLGLALAQVTYDDCCFKYVAKMKPRTQKHAVDYRVQVIDGGCNIAAVIFRMRKGRELCTDPRETWVQQLMMTVDEKKAKAKQTRKHHSRQPYRG